MFARFTQNANSPQEVLDKTLKLPRVRGLVSCHDFRNPALNSLFCRSDAKSDRSCVFAILPAAAVCMLYWRTKKQRPKQMSGGIPPLHRAMQELSCRSAQQPPPEHPTIPARERCAPSRRAREFLRAVVVPPLRDTKRCWRHHALSIFPAMAPAHFASY